MNNMNNSNATPATYGSLNEMITQAIKKNWDNIAFSDYGGINYRYCDVAEQIVKLHIIFHTAGLKPGDKVAICGRNSSNWAICYLACLTSGVVAVPILHEFKPDVITHLVNHSDARLFFVDEAIWKTLDAEQLPQLRAAIYLAEFGMPLSRDPRIAEARQRVNELFGAMFPADFLPSDIEFYHDQPEDLALINYTSGSTGMSKGVMLPYRSIWSNVRFCNDSLDFMNPGDGIVNMLPLAHLYGMTIEMLFPFTHGCHCYFLTRVPSPKIILAAFAEVRPKLIITVPLILEKIIRTKVFPLLEKPMMKFLLRVPFVDDRLLARIREGLMQAFGGQLRQLVVGGAALNQEIASFLTRIGFPYTVGYGMTECGPLISYTAPAFTKLGSVGRPVARVEVRIDSPDPVSIPGNILVRGANLMKGYYKNEEATKEVMRPDGWMNTGDLGIMDPDGFLHILGRTKTMILGPSGQNIYPEEIEQKLNNMPYVAESLVIEDGGKLIALVYPDKETVEAEKLDADALQKAMKENLSTLNQELPAYSKISDIRLMETEFEKTPKRSIKRYLYQPQQS